MKNPYFLVPILVFIVLLKGCDTPPGTDDPTQSTADLRQIEVQPDSISFRDISTLYDTTVTIRISAVVTQMPESATPSFSIESANDSLITRGPLNPGDSAHHFQATVDLSLNTATFATYHTYVYAQENTPSGSWLQSTINIYGLSGSPPRILAVNNPDTVHKPSGDSVRNVPFQAEVVDPDGQDNIEIVAFQLIQGENLLETIELFDDGSENSGDPTAGDSVYTQILSVDAGNQNATYDIHYFARDKSNLVSDTAKTTFTITD